MADPKLPNPNLINSTRQDLSAGFLEASFGILGNTFANDSGNPQDAEPYKKLGSVISSTLHDRWYKQEYENFQAQYVNSYQQAGNSIRTGLQMQMSSLDRGELLQPDGSITKIDTKSEGFLRTKDTVIRQSASAIQKINDQFLQDAGKYTNNPYISDIAQNLMASQAQIIAQATGPTAAQASEEGLAKIDTERSQKRYLDRLPALSGSGNEKENKRGDPRALLSELGYQGFGEMLVGTPNGREWTEPFQKTAESQIKQELLKKDPRLADDPDMLALRMRGQENAVQERAAGLYFKTTFPEEAREIEGLPEFDRFFPEPVEEEAEAPQISGLLTKKETEMRVDELSQGALDELERIVKEEDPKNIDQAIDQVINRWLPSTLERTTSKNASKFRAEAKRALIKFLSDPENWSQKKVIQETFGGPEQDLPSRLFRKATRFKMPVLNVNVPETKEQKPKGGLL